jgi:phosphatidylserine decarboxylase
MDRVHRLGQTRQVTVYRLLTAGTIEERIIQRAHEKDRIQKVVIQGGSFKMEEFKSKEIVSLLLEDEPTTVLPLGKKRKSKPFFSAPYVYLFHNFFTNRRSICIIVCWSG